MKTTIKDGAIKRRNGLPPIHPGEIIKQDILPSVGLSVTATARALGVSRQMLHAILAGRKPLSAVMCLRVARLFGGSPKLWMDLQATFDLKKSMQNKKVMEGIARIVPLNGIEERARKPDPILQDLPLILPQPPKSFPQPIVTSDPAHCDI